MLVAVGVLVGAFGLVNGMHDAGNAIAAPVATRALRPGPAVAMAAVFHLVGALVVGTAVATTVAGIIRVPAGHVLAVLAAATLGALVWNVTTLVWSLPCSSGHCLVGALAGAAVADGGTGAVNWGGLHGIRPVGVWGSLLWLAFATAAAVPLGTGGVRLARRVLRRARREVLVPVRRGEIAASAGLAFAHGSNDAQKTMGLMTAALVADGRLTHFTVPWWVVVSAALLLSVGTMLGGWRVVRTLGQRLYRLHSIDGLVSQGTSASIVLLASLAGAPVSTTDVVAPAVVGVGTGERWRRVGWPIVGRIGAAWLVTLPVSALLGALFLPFWRWVA